MDEEFHRECFDPSNSRKDIDKDIVEHQVVEEPTHHTTTILTQLRQSHKGRENVEARN